MFLKTTLFIFIFIVLIPAVSFCQGAGDEDIPEGMELIEVGTVKLVVPEEAQVKQVAGLIIVESIDQYVARAISRMKELLEKMELKYQGLENNFKKLEEEVEGLRKEKNASSK